MSSDIPSGVSELHRSARQMKATDHRVALRFWEIRRVIFTLAISAPAYLGWEISIGLNSGIDDLPVPHFFDPYVFTQFVAAFVLANVAYSMCYVFEYFVEPTTFRDTTVSLMRAALLTLLLCCGAFTSFAVGGRIAHTSSLQLAVFPSQR